MKATIKEIGIVNAMMKVALQRPKNKNTIKITKIKAYIKDSCKLLIDLMMKSEKLRESAKANTESDFAFSYFDGIDDALIEGLSQNQDFFSLLLSNDEMKKEVLGIFVSEIYKSLREDK